MDNQVDQYHFQRVGQDVVIYPLAKIVTPQVISIGDSVSIDDYAFVVGGVQTTIGSFVHVAAHALLGGGGELIMEDFSAVSSGVKVFTGNEDYSGASLTNPTVPPPYRQPLRGWVRIEQHAVVGANSVILPGVVIGMGAVIAPNSVVAQDCMPWRLYAGNPIRPIKARPSEQILELEAQLRAECYTADGQYIPKAQRDPKPQ